MNEINISFLSYHIIKNHIKYCHHICFGLIIIRFIYFFVKDDYRHIIVLKFNFSFVVLILFVYFAALKRDEMKGKIIDFCCLIIELS